MCNLVVAVDGRVVGTSILSWSGRQSCELRGLSRVLAQCDLEKFDDLISVDDWIVCV